MSMLVPSFRCAKRLASLSLTLALVGVPVARAQVAGLTGTLVVTNKTPSTATIVDVASGRTLATLPTGTTPHEIVLSSDGALAVTTDYGGARRTLTVIDVPGLRVARTIDLGEHRAPHGIAFLPGDRVVAVTCEQTRNVVLVDVVEGVVRHAVPTEARWLAHGRRHRATASAATRATWAITRCPSSTSPRIASCGASLCRRRPRRSTSRPTARRSGSAAIRPGRSACSIRPPARSPRPLEGLKWPYRHAVHAGRPAGHRSRSDAERGALHRPCGSPGNREARPARCAAGRHDQPERASRVPVAECRGAGRDHRSGEAHGRRPPHGWRRRPMASPTPRASSRKAPVSNGLPGTRGPAGLSARAGNRPRGFR